MLAVLCLAMPAAADAIGFTKAWQAAQKGEFQTARAGISSADQSERTLLTWAMLKHKNNGGTFQDYAKFLRANPGWPDEKTLQLRAEELIGADVAAADVVAWFQYAPPMTSDGMARYANALLAQQQESAARTAMQEFFTQRDFSAASAQRLMADFPDLVSAQDLAARVDNLLWRGQASAAKDLLGYLDGHERAAAEARIALQTNADSASQLVQSLSSSAARSAGVMYDRAAWRFARGDMDGAADILASLTTPNEHGEDAARLRNKIARAYFEQGNTRKAYRVAASQPPRPGASETDNLWYAGWIALRSLNDPSRAVSHFADFYNQVATPISRARGAYWLGRTAEAAGQETTARDWYAAASQIGTTFYGQLASAKLGQPIVVPASVSPNHNAAILSDGRLKSAQLLAQIGDNDNARRFFRAALDSVKDDATLAAMAEWAMRRDRWQWAVMAGKASQRNGSAGILAGYPVLPKDLQAKMDHRLDGALAHALIRQESEFDQFAVSRSGALGLMQLMPKTAAYVARKMGIGHSKSALTSEPAHNVQLGSRYIADQLEKFNHPYLAMAAYNAGPGRVGQWLGKIGDPRNASIDEIDWVETIPVYETRNYVQRVTENKNIYRALLDRHTASR